MSSLPKPRLYPKSETFGSFPLHFSQLACTSPARRVACWSRIKSLKIRVLRTTVFRGSADRVGKRRAARRVERFRERPSRLYTAKTFCL